jgi:hypothetical protein
MAQRLITDEQAMKQIYNCLKSKMGKERDLIQSAMDIVTALFDIILIIRDTGRQI